MKCVIIISLIVFLVSLEAAAQPNPIYPTNTIHTLTPAFQWSAVPSAISYHLQVFAGPTAVIDQTTAQNEYQTPTGVLSANTQYYWRVVSENPSGTVWPVNTYFNITLAPEPPALLLPADSAMLCSGSVMFDWTDVTGALSYRIQVSADSNFSNPVIDVSGLTNSGYTGGAGIFNYYTVYYWRAMAYYSGGYTNWSAKRRFVVGSVPAAPVYITCPVGTIHTLTPVFIWSASAGTIGYRVMFSVNAGFTVMLYDTTVYGSALTLRSGVLMYNTPVFYRSCGLSACGQGPWSTVNSFTVTPLGINKISEEVPSEFSLSQNYPNPFNQSSIFRFQCSMKGHVNVSVYDITGREVQTLVNETLEAGTYEVRFDGSGLNSGVYFVRMSAGEFSETRRTVLLK